VNWDFNCEFVEDVTSEHFVGGIATSDIVMGHCFWCLLSDWHIVAWYIWCDCLSSQVS